MRRNSPEFYQTGPNDKIEVPRNETGDNLVDFMSRSNILTKLETSDSRKKFLSNLKPEEYQNILIRINGILRGISLRDREFDGDEVGLEGFAGEYTPPRQKDKIDLINESLESSKRLDKIEDEALMLATVLVATHPFSDGNGRTSRTLYYLIKEGVSDDNLEILKTLVDENGRDEVNINPGFISYEIEKIQQYDLLKDHLKEIETKTYPNYLFYSPAKLKFQKSINEQRITKIKGILKDGFFGFSAVYQFLNEHGWRPNYIKTFSDKNTGEALRTPIVMEEVAPDLSEQDIDEILENYWTSKKQYVEHMIRMYTEPEKYKSPKQEFNTLKDYYTHRVKTSKIED